MSAAIMPSVPSQALAAVKSGNDSIPRKVQCYRCDGFAGSDMGYTCKKQVIFQ